MPKKDGGKGEEDELGVSHQVRWEFKLDTCTLINCLPAAPTNNGCKAVCHWEVLEMRRSNSNLGGENLIQSGDC